MKNALDSFYQSSPIRIQNLAISAFGWRLNRKRYTSAYAELEHQVFDRLKLNQENWRKLCNQRLQETVIHAARSTPHYRNLFHKLDIDPTSIREPRDLDRLPTTTKKDVQNNLNRFHSDDITHLNTSIWKTSGTTGTGLVFPMSLRGEQEQWAIWWRYRSQFGINRDTWYAHFYGKNIVPLRQNKPPFWRTNQPGKQILFSGYHMRDENLPAYIDELNRRRAGWIQGYPSLLALLAGFMLATGRGLTYRPTIVTTGAESLLPQQRQIIEAAFGAPCRQHYGTTEAVANISECIYGRLHVDEDFGCLEFAPLGNGLHRIIATGYANQAFPLIRYEVGDNVILPETSVECSCGHPGQVVESIDGRIEDYVITASGARVGRLDHILKDFVNIRECQIHQNTPGQVTFRVVRGPEYSEVDTNRLIEEAKKRLGHDMDIILEYANDLHRSRTGKLRFVVSSIKEGKLVDNNNT